MTYEIRKNSEWFVREEQKIYDARGEGILARKRKRFRLIDVFAGAGGMTLGFSKMFGHAFDSIWANDFNADCVRTYRRDFGDHCVSGDIVDILKDPATEIPPADVVIGGPPCQGFSLLNKNREGDPRKQLWRPYFEIVERSGARVFVTLSKSRVDEQLMCRYHDHPIRRPHRFLPGVEYLTWHHKNRFRQ